MCIGRKFRVWRVLPPRYERGAPSKTQTLDPFSAATIAATMPACPPPATTTS